MEVTTFWAYPESTPIRIQLIVRNTLWLQVPATFSQTYRDIYS